MGTWINFENLISDCDLRFEIDHTHYIYPPKQGVGVWAEGLILLLTIDVLKTDEVTLSLSLGLTFYSGQCAQKHRIAR